MITDLIVATSLVLTGGFLLGWLLSPAWRARIEAPKHQFQEALRAFDESGGSRAAGGRTP